ncbi:MAG: DEAD/DEAH box helicase [Candidatus Gracilibacteria bacterium]|nr:DEAD/DEAH box helicase [Candidatus Gracilibacteria bacterium]
MITFQNIGLSENILKALDEMGFKEPTPIQAKAIPFILENEKDLIALAQTGTGKTAAFTLPLLDKIEADSKTPQVLILSPTRELCMQTAKNVESFIKYSKDLKVLAVYGGTRIDQQIRNLRNGAQIIVGTPGRALDMINRGALNVNTIQYVVLDEADEMLNMGFKEELDGILAGTPEDKQTLLFSATMPKSVLSISKQYMKSPEEISAGKENTGADKVDHLYYMVHARDRYHALRRIADVNPDIYGIVFCRTRRETQEVSDKLIQNHYSAEAIHGDLSQQQRSNVMERFRKKKIQILVATDVAARGIDVDDLTHVINYQLPDSIEAYIHRSGRTGRAQKSGTSISIIHMKEVGKIRATERRVGKKFIQAQVPKGSDICKSQLFSLITKIKTTEVKEEQIGPYLAEITEQLEDLSREELIKQFVSAEFNRFLMAYKDAPDLNTSSKSQDREPRKRNENFTFTTVSLNLGKKDAFGIKRLFSLINQFPQMRGIEIGNIQIQDFYSLLEIDVNRLQDFLDTFKGENYRGKPLEGKVSNEKATGYDQRGSGDSRRGRGGSRGGRGGDRRSGGYQRGGGGGGYKKNYGGKSRPDRNERRKRR